MYHQHQFYIGSDSAGVNKDHIRCENSLASVDKWGQESGAMAGQPGSSHVGLLEKQPPQTKQKYTVLGNHTIMAYYYKSEPRKWG